MHLIYLNAQTTKHPCVALDPEDLEMATKVEAVRASVSSSTRLNEIHAFASAGNYKQ